MGTLVFLVVAGIVLLGVVGIGTVVVILLRALMKHVHGVEPSKLFADSRVADAPPQRDEADSSSSDEGSLSCNDSSLSSSSD